MHPRANERSVVAGFDQGVEFAPGGLHAVDDLGNCEVLGQRGSSSLSARVLSIVGSCSLSAARARSAEETLVTRSRCARCAAIAPVSPAGA